MAPLARWLIRPRGWCGSYRRGGSRLKWTVAGLLAFYGCGPGPDDWPADWPQIVDLVYLGQRPQVPRELLFFVQFRDGDGDLGGGGAVELEIDGEVQGRLALAMVFAAQVPPLGLESESGGLELSVRIQSRLGAGDRVRVGFRLEDARGNASNEPYLVLEAL